MEIKINVDETQFKDVLENELKAFTEKELHEIIRDGLIKCMSNVETFKTLFVTEHNNYYGNGGTVEANKILTDAANTIDLSPLFEEFKENALQYLKNNYQHVIDKMLLDIFMQGFSNNLQYGGSFMENVKCEIQNALWNHMDSAHNKEN